MCIDGIKFPRSCDPPSEGHRPLAAPSIRSETTLETRPPTVRRYLPRTRASTSGKREIPFEQPFLYTELFGFFDIDGPSIRESIEFDVYSAPLRTVDLTRSEFYGTNLINFHLAAGISNVVDETLLVEVYSGDVVFPPNR